MHVAKRVRRTLRFVKADAEDGSSTEQPILGLKTPTAYQESDHGTTGESFSIQ